MYFAAPANDEASSPLTPRTRARQREDMVDAALEKMEFFERVAEARVESTSVVDVLLYKCDKVCVYVCMYVCVCVCVCVVCVCVCVCVCVFRCPEAASARARRPKRGPSLAVYKLSHRQLEEREVVRENARVFARFSSQKARAVSPAQLASEFQQSRVYAAHVSRVDVDARIATAGGGRESPASARRAQSPRPEWELRIPLPLPPRRPVSASWELPEARSARAAAARRLVQSRVGAPLAPESRVGARLPWDERFVLAAMPPVPPPPKPRGGRPAKALPRGGTENARQAKAQVQGARRLKHRRHFTVSPPV